MASLAKAQRILQKWEIQGEIQKIEKGGYSGSSIYIVITRDQKLILRQWNKNLIRSQKPIKHLLSKGFKFVPKFIPLVNSSETYLEVGTDVWELTTFLDGVKALEPVSEKAAFNLGKVIAEFHEGFVDFQVEEDTKRDTNLEELSKEDWVEWWGSLGKEAITLTKQWGLDEDIVEYIHLVDRCFKKYIQNNDWKQIDRSIPQGIVHRDLWKENVFFDKDQVNGIIDFGTIRYGRRIDDINRLITEFSEWNELLISNVLKGYESVSKLSQLEKEHFNALMLLVGPLRGTYIIKQAIEQRNSFKDYPVTLEKFIRNFRQNIMHIENYDFQKHFA